MHRNLCVVGDPDQSIYKWRGADIRNILDFERDFPDAVTVKLERNYRSTQVILDAASAVISHNRDRKDKRLWTDQAGGAPIVTYRGVDELDEADFIVKVGAAGGAGRLRGRGRRPLPHQRAVARHRRRACAPPASPTRSSAASGFYERKEIKDALAYLKLVLNPHDDVACGASSTLPRAASARASWTRSSASTRRRRISGRRRSWPVST